MNTQENSDTGKEWKWPQGKKTNKTTQVNGRSNKTAKKENKREAIRKLEIGSSLQPEGFHRIHEICSTITMATTNQLYHRHCMSTTVCLIQSFVMLASLSSSQNFTVRVGVLPDAASASSFVRILWSFVIFTLWWASTQVLHSHSPHSTQNPIVPALSSQLVHTLERQHQLAPKTKYQNVVISYQHHNLVFFFFFKHHFWDNVTFCATKKKKKKK